MWIKALDRYVWVNMKHITHFTIETDDEPFRKGNRFVYAYLDANSRRYQNRWETDQTRILVCEGSTEECEQFIVEKQLLESAFQWLGYLVAGGVGAVLTLIFKNGSP